MAEIGGTGLEPVIPSLLTRSESVSLLRCSAVCCRESAVDCLDDPFAHHKLTGLATEVISNRALNRALLERQLLLRRRKLTAGKVIEHLVGLQAQAPNAAYVGLWSRVEEFRPDELAGLIEGRRAVRMTLFRGTVHLVTEDDCQTLRPLLQIVLERIFRSSPWAKNLAGLDWARVVSAGRALLETPRTRAELGRLLAERFPDRDPASLAYATTFLLPTVQAPPRGVWGQSGAAKWVSTESWLGRVATLATASPSAAVMRYLRAFGPASAADVATWSGFTGTGRMLDELRPQLRTYRDERGRELFDVEDGLLPAEDTPAPPRFLPEYDNVLLSHADRSRIIEGNRKPHLPPGIGARAGTVLIDGFMRAEWRLERSDGTVLLAVAPYKRLTRSDQNDVTREGERLLTFLAPETSSNGVRISDGVTSAATS
jgi:hypothetical protein